MLLVNHDLEARVLECRKGKRWQDAYDILMPVMLEARGSLLGRARLQWAITDNSAGTRNVVDVLSMVDSALPLLRDELPFDFMRGIVLGLIGAAVVSDEERAADYLRQSDEVFAQGSPEADKWRGHILIHRAYRCQRKAASAEMSGDAAEVEKRRCRALARADEALAFFAENEGPFGPGDRECQVNMARSAKADILWQMGRRSESIAIMRVLLAAEAPGNTGSREFLAGRIAFGEGRIDEAVQYLKAAAELAAAKRDHVFRFKIGELLCEVYLSAGNRTDFRRLMDDLLDEVTDAGASVTLYRLQQLSKRAKGGDAR